MLPDVLPTTPLAHVAVTFVGSRLSQLASPRASAPPCVIVAIICFVSPHVSVNVGCSGVTVHASTYVVGVTVVLERTISRLSAGQSTVAFPSGQPHART